MRIALTMRIFKNPSSGIYFDALSTDWISHLNSQGHDMLPLLNDESTIVNTVSRFKPDLVILTGGEDLIGKPKNALEKVLYRRDRSERTLLKWVIKNKVPCLGVCRGSQMLNIYFGGTVTRSDDGIHLVKHHPVSFLDTLSFFPKRMSVNSFHKWGFRKKDLAKDFVPIATDQDGMIECFYHHKFPMMGMLWHPERVFDSPLSTKFHNKKFYDILMKLLHKRKGK